MRRAAALVIATIALIHVSYYFPRCVDDLFISLRFAESFAHGRGIVFNPGERVEGYSSPLWMLLQAIGFVFHFEGVTWTKLLGLASLAALLVGVERFARELLDVRALPALLAPLFLALDSHVIAWSVLGLETPAALALLVWYPIVLRRYLNGPSRRSAWIAGAVTVALACVRPEAPLFIGVMGLGELLARPAPAGTPSPDAAITTLLRARFITVLRVAVPVLAVLLALLVARRLYFGAWLPNTYYVKGATSGFELAKLNPLVAEGVGSAERFFYVGGIVLAGSLAVTRRCPALVAGMLCTLFFTASVERDWMPSLRHLLPVAVLAAIAWTWAVDALDRAGASLGAYSRYLGIGLAVLVGVAGVRLAAVDSRLSLADKRNKEWVVPKTAENLRDAWLALRGLEPPHVARLGSFEMGLITQNYRVLEAAAAPVEDSWFVGRDIGQVGFYTGVRVFDTPGLFTPDVVHSVTWQRDHRVDSALVRKAFAHAPVAAETLDAWTPAIAGELDIVARYDIAVGGPSHPIDLMQADRPLPAPEEVLRRYEQSLAKFPTWFCLATLYGESAGGAMRKRVRRVREMVEAARATKEDPAKGASAEPLDRAHGGGAMLEGRIEALGCELTPPEVRPGSDVTVACSWRALAQPTRSYWTFLHFDDARGVVTFQEDHPTGVFRPTRRWEAGEVVRDVARVTVPASAAPGQYHLFFGMWKAELRPTVTPVEMSDGKNRIAGPLLQVVP